ncbi:MAG: adaptor protein MecA [Lachnospiraceae bacterium]|nr:adaptor protein MecA [Lachnospiraceae bacterium]
MKIEKVNDSQIRCTLTREDLASRKLKISELAYGTKKAKDLFRDMMEMANFEYGFEADNIPLMIEAIPMNSECIVLIITKVEDPDELDTRFSKFAPGVHSDDDDELNEADFEEDDESSPVDETGLSDLFNRFKDALEKKTQEISNTEIKLDGMAFSFDKMSDVAKVARSLNSFYCDESKLYSNKENGSYLLVLKRDKMDMIDFVKACNLASEFGGPMKGAHLGEAYIEEHYEIICPSDALSTVSFL